MIGSIVLLALIYAVQFTFGIPMWHDVMNKSSIANIHTLSSVCAMLLFLPCSGVLSKLAMLTVPDNAEEAQELSMPVLDERLFKSRPWPCSKPRTRWSKCPAVPPATSIWLRRCC